MKIVFFGTSVVGIPILKELALKNEVIQVVTNPDQKVGRQQILTASPIAKFARDQNIPITQPEKVKANIDLKNQLKHLNADIFIVVSYGKILPTEIINMPKYGTLNIHFSLLPKYRGPSPIQYVLLAGEKKTGTTIFKLDELVDHGPILAQAELPISANDNFTSLSEKLAQLSAGLLSDILPKYLSGTLTPQEQQHSLATTTKLISKESGQINFQEETAEEIYNKFRAFILWPGIHFIYKNSPVKILSCSPVSENQSITNQVVVCKNNTLLVINQLQLAGKKPISFTDFLNGHPNFLQFVS